MTTQDGHPVVGFLAGVHDPIAGGIGVRDWKLFVGELGFLQGKQVGLVSIQPGQHLREADAKRVDVPAGDSGHSRKPPCRRRCR